MKLARVNFKGDTPIFGMWKKYIDVQSSPNGEPNYDISTDGIWIWIEFLQAPNAGKITGVPRENVYSVVPADPEEVKRRRDAPAKDAAKK